MTKYFFLFVLLALLLTDCRSSILDDPSVTISYSIAQRSHVKLTIENNYNTVILTPVDRTQDAGTYEVSFDASHLLEGVYYYSLECRGINNNDYYQTTRKMLLIK